MPILIPGGGYSASNPSGGVGVQNALAGNASLAQMQFFQLPEAYLGSGKPSNNNIFPSNNTNSNSVIDASHGNHLNLLPTAASNSNHAQSLERKVFQEFWENLKMQQGAETKSAPAMARGGGGVLMRGEMEDDSEMKGAHRKTDNFGVLISFRFFFFFVITCFFFFFFFFWI
jgi:hypothetical protein